MAISKRDKQELEQCYSDHKELGGRKEDYFPILYLMNKFKCDIKEIRHNVAFGNNDYGVDAFYLDKGSKNLYLYQFKWSEDHNLFKESLDRLSTDGFQIIFGDPYYKDKNEMLNHLKAELFECQSLIERIYVEFIFKGDAEAAENAAGLQLRREDLEKKKYLIDQFFKRHQVDLVIEFLSDIKKPPRPPLQYTHVVSARNFATLHTSENDRHLHIGFIPLADLYNIYVSLGQRFFDRNIRAGLSPDNPPNKKIREALRDIVIRKTVSPELFVFNHNGITLAAEKVDFNDGNLTLHSPNLLNGAQTISSYHRFIEENANNQVLKQNQDILNQIYVLAKVVECDLNKDSDFVTTVTISNNRQNPVDPWNLRANDKIQCDLQDKLKEESKIFYSRQENAFSNYSESELQDIGIDEISKDIRIKPLAQTFLAIQGEVDKMSRLTEIFENQNYYGSTFRESYLHSDSRKIILCYKVHYMLSGSMKKIEERAASKYAYHISRARNLVWAMLIQGLLNDPKLSEFLEDFGVDLRKQTGFSEVLKNLAATKILQILRELFEDKDIKEKIEEEKYSFLRNKVVFKKCMDIAYDKYKWTKKTI